MFTVKTPHSTFNSKTIEWMRKKRRFFCVLLDHFPHTITVTYDLGQHFWYYGNVWQVIGFHCISCWSVDLKSNSGATAVVCFLFIYLFLLPICVHSAIICCVSTNEPFCLHSPNKQLLLLPKIQNASLPVHQRPKGSGWL